MLEGNHIVEKDLIYFCDNKIKSAILDVFTVEPLPRNIFLGK